MKTLLEKLKGGDRRSPGKVKEVKMADNSIQIRPMKQEEIPAVSDLVSRSFKSNVAPYYSEEGVETFLDYANPNAMTARFLENHFILVARRAQALIGMIEIRGNGHISLFFVEPLEQQKGVGRILLKKAIAVIQDANPDMKLLTVNSSPNSVEAYKRFGFAPTNTFQEKNGIQFMPMALELMQAGKTKLI